MDRKKYIVEASDDVKKVIAMGVTRGGAIWTDTTDIENFEELNSDYINEHFGDLQDTAYQKGLNDAWECGKKLAWTAKYGGYGDRLNDVFGRDDTFDFYDYTPNEAIEKLKAFEQKQDKIEVGDEVLPFYTDVTGVVTLIDGDTIYVLWRDGSSTSTLKLKEVTKTGRHFDIASILEDMRND